MAKLSTSELKALLVKNWMTHDAIWFHRCIQECGIGRANELNKAAVRSMAAIEINRIKKALGIEEVESFDQLVQLIEEAQEVIGTDLMEFTFSHPEDSVIRWDMHRCFAYEGTKKMGIIDRYDCGIFDRLEGWLDGLGVEYKVTPAVTGCMMHTEGRCFREYSLQGVVPGHP